MASSINRYTNGKIYKIVSDHTEQVYIGSTVQRLSNRMSAHRSSYKKHLIDKKKNYSSFNILCYPDAKIILIENFSCDCKDELFKQERFYIETMDCCNKNIPNRTHKEWYEDNPEYNKEYYKKNEDHIKQYQQKNKDHIKQYQQQYREKNEDIINKKIQCDICESVVIKRNIKKHQQSKKCLACVQ